MIFSEYNITVDNRKINKEDINNFIKINNISKRFEYKDKFYEIESKFAEERFWYIYIKFDDNVYNNKVWDTNDDKIKPNPKTRQQVEFRHQIFICYDLKEDLLYSSKSIKQMKKTMIQDMIEQNIGKKCYIKSIIADLKEFKNQVSSLTKIKFTNTRNLISLQDGYDDMFKPTILNPYGLDAPSKLIIEYDKIPFDKNLLDLIKKDKDNGKFKNVVIVGKTIDEDTIELDFSNLTQKIIIDVNKDKNGMYDEKDVLSSLLNKIKIEKSDNLV